MPAHTLPADRVRPIGSWVHEGWHSALAAANADVGGEFSSGSLGLLGIVPGPAAADGALLLTGCSCPLPEADLTKPRGNLSPALALVLGPLLFSLRHDPLAAVVQHSKLFLLLHGICPKVFYYRSCEHMY